ncbi:MAG: hypothetical protein PVF57_16025 [Pseudomonadales bacterium]|jgi:hypothetical protein
MGRDRQAQGYCRGIGFLVFALALALLPAAGRADGALTGEPDPTSYHYVAHYAVRIDASADVVWPHLRRMNEWMYEFELSHVSGTPGAEGEVRRLYADQDFFIQVTRQIPDRLLVIANLPSTFEGEYSTGVAVITLDDSNDGMTTVDLTMSRRYTWLGEGENPLRARRASAAFTESNDAMWERFLDRLRTLAEAP